jgi:hypothetical protein
VGTVPVYGIDADTDTLVRITDMGGHDAIVGIGSLGIDASPLNGFDIHLSGTAYAAFESADHTHSD